MQNPGIGEISSLIADLCSVQHLVVCIPAGLRQVGIHDRRKEQHNRVKEVDQRNADLSPLQATA